VFDAHLIAKHGIKKRRDRNGGLAALAGEGEDLSEGGQGAGERGGGTKGTGQTSALMFDKEDIGGGKNLSRGKGTSQP